MANKAIPGSKHENQEALAHGELEAAVPDSSATCAEGKQVRQPPADKKFPHGLLTLPPEVKQEEIKYIINRRKAVGWLAEGADPQKTQQQASGDKKRKKAESKDGESDEEKEPREERKQEDERNQDKIRAELVGLAFSGGGIRSATFSLGVVQKLAQCGLLPLADYLCTVSGGGYLGSCLSSLMSFPGKDQLGEPDPKPYSPDKHDPLWWKRQRAKKSFTGNHRCGASDQPESPEAPRFDMDAQNPLLLREQCHHLRKRGDFVMVRQGLVRRETLRSVAWFLIGLLSTLTMYTFFVLACAGLFVSVASNLGGFDVWSVSHQSFGRLLIDSLSKHLAEFAWSIALGSFAGFVIWLMLMYAQIPARNGSASEIGSDIEERGRLQAITVILLAALMVACQTVLWLHVALGERLFGLCLPLGFVLGLLLALGVLNVVWLPRSQQRWNRRQRSLLGAAYGLGCLLLIAALLLPGLVWTIGILKSSSTWLPAVAAASLAALRLLVPLVSRFADKPGMAGMAGRLIVSSGLLLLAVVFMAATFLLASSAVLRLGQAGWQIWPLGVPGWALLTAVVSLAAFVAAGLLIDFNRIGPHYFYRDRLAEAYLQTEADLRSSDAGDCAGAIGHARLELVRNDEQLPLKHLLDWPDQRNPAPYHLIECAINLAGSRDLARRNRMSDHFVFSREFCGSGVTGYVPTRDYRGGKTKLATAMTLSGAAVGSGVGFRTSFVQSFATTLFNIRLGSWLVNPRIYEDPKVPVPVYHSIHASPRPWAASRGFFSRSWRRFSGALVRKTQEAWVFWPFYLAQEMFAGTDAESALVNLSDGGHTGDNIGLYPLLQRRCRLILAVDGEADPNYDFGSLAAGISQIFIDENVSVEFNLDALRSDQGGRAKSHYLIGKITYPRCTEVEDPPQRTKHLGSLEREGGCGWIIYLKSSLTGRGTPASIASYAAFNKEFPHQSTLDQFFDDDQFEAYRALGDHVTSTVLADFLQWFGAKEEGGTDQAAPATHVPADLDEFATLAKQSPSKLVDLLQQWAEDKFREQQRAVQPAR
jgi:hypothetical protein